MAISRNGHAKVNGQTVDGVSTPRFDTEASGKSNAAGPTRPEGKKSPMKVILALTALAAVAFSASTAGYHWLNVGRYSESTDDAYVGGDVTFLASKAPGFVSQITVADNQAVHAGDLLVKLDDRDYRAALAKAEAAVAYQHAALANLVATRSLQQAIIGQADASIAAAEAEITRTRDEQTRFAQLLKETAVSLQDAQKAEAAYKEAEAHGEKARAGLTAAQRQLGVLDAQELQIQAALAQAEAERDLARLNLSYTEIRAPMDGTVGNRTAQAGSYATSGSQLIALIPAHGLWVDANLKESQLAHVRAGAPATVEVDSMPGKILHGRVVSIAPATGSRFSILPPENATGNFTKIVQRVPVRIVLDNEEEAGDQLRPGLSVTAKINTTPTTTQIERSSL